jgi:ATP-dependent DNA ligase
MLLARYLQEGAFDRRTIEAMTTAFHAVCKSLHLTVRLLAKAPAGIRYSGHLDGNGATIFAHACNLGLEGIVSKHREHPYRSGPSKAWLKTKNPMAPGMLRFKDDEP